MFKTIITKLSTRRRHALKNKVFMSSHKLLQMSRQILSLSLRSSVNDEIHYIIEQMIMYNIGIFTIRVRSLSKSSNEKKYIKYVINKHIRSVINYAIHEHVFHLKSTATFIGKWRQAIDDDRRQATNILCAIRSLQLQRYHRLCYHSIKNN